MSGEHERMTEPTMRNLNAAFRFVLELLVLLALFLFGIGATDNLLIGLPIAIVLIAIVVTIWGLFVAPKATYRLKDPARLGVELLAPRRHRDLLHLRFLADRIRAWGGPPDLRLQAVLAKQR